MKDEKRGSKRERAIALAYNPEIDRAPVVMAKGAGDLAKRIKEIAEEFAIPIYSDPSLVEVLAKLEVNQEIPALLYKAIAEILVFVYQADKSYEGRARPKG
ncbi:MAG: EscU/YscU/HrcU family type III secretion system export apparatus switch protein [Actinomycetota bacterium]|nr:EscU/YscU/HrcU family type III secretion system export apparatus switch protein [Actinomycetota bacterium]